MFSGSALVLPSLWLCETRLLSGSLPEVTHCGCLNMLAAIPIWPETYNLTIFGVEGIIVLFEFGANKLNEFGECGYCSHVVVRSFVWSLMALSSNKMMRVPSARKYTVLICFLFELKMQVINLSAQNNLDKNRYSNGVWLIEFRHCYLMPHNNL